MFFNLFFTRSEGNTLINEIEKLNNEINELNKSLKIEKSGHNKVKTLYDEFYTTYTKLSKDYHDLKNKSDKEGKNTSVLLEEVKKLREKLSFEYVTHTANTQLRIDINNLYSELEDLKTKNSNLLGEINQLNNEKAYLLSEVDELKKKLEKFEAENIALKSNSQFLSEKIFNIEDLAKAIVKSLDV